MALSAFWPLALFFVFSALAFGCMEGWAIATCEVILFAGAAAVGWGRPAFWSVPRRLWLPALLLLALLAVGLLQLVPLPASWWAAAGSDRYTRFSEGAEAERLLHTDAYRRDPFGPAPEAPLPPETWSALVPPVPAWLPGSFTPASTARALLALAAALCLILLLEWLAEEEPRRLRWLFGLCGGLGGGIALLAVAQSSDPGRTTLLGFRESAQAGIAFGPFVNANHGTAFVNLTVPVACYLLWRASAGVRRSSDRYGIRAVALALVALQVAAVGVSQSLGGLLAIGLLPVALFCSLLPRSRTALAAVAAGGLLFAAWLLWAAFAWGLVPDHGRLRLLKNLPTGHWVAGSGLGSFGERYPAVATDGIMLDPVHYSHLENEYLQVFFEAGLLPALLATLVGAAVLYLAARLALEGSAEVWLAPALAAEAARCTIDFSMHCFPVVGALLLLCIAGMVALEGGLAWSERPRRLAPRVKGAAP